MTELFNAFKLPETDCEMTTKEKIVGTLGVIGLIVGVVAWTVLLSALVG